MNHIEAAQALGLDPYVLMKMYCPHIILIGHTLKINGRYCGTGKRDEESGMYSCARPCWEDEVIDQVLIDRVLKIRRVDTVGPND